MTTTRYLPFLRLKSLHVLLTGTTAPNPDAILPETAHLRRDVGLSEDIEVFNLEIRLSAKGRLS